MEELAKALAEAVKTGAAAAGPAIHSYFTFQIWTYVISYGFPCLTILTLGGLTAFILNKVISKIEQDDSFRKEFNYLDGEVRRLRQEVSQLKSLAK